ncbi:hypothetical protein ISN45_At03g014720 [Arabidopsis thaliana x Arabidopsis arenosa]|uniref:Uncharacterized protein n=1 Tax=Arabidopsis thaliana x Arabidopsis arenosa TaxID=1240361 RepID=A0A8T2EUG9_9BRAS|nr:hypothetical protein ISN45_At03g014720 [Arabidopsis thaliana x Arabidopsis arenosa]
MDIWSTPKFQISVFKDRAWIFEPKVYIVCGLAFFKGFITGRVEYEFQHQQS